MSNELSGVSASGTLYTRIRNAAGLWWNGASFEAYSAANYSDYVITMTEEGDSGVYIADFPSAVTIGGTYEYFVHLQAGGSPAEGDYVINTGKIDWTGAVSVSSIAGAMSGSEWQAYVLLQGFVRTDKSTELFECTTDAIQEMRVRFMFDEAEAEMITTDTITVLGDFKLDVEDDFGLVLGVVVEDDDTGLQLVKVTKSQYDELYPDVNVTADRGFPKHFCLYAGQIYIGPIPDQVDYDYRISYSKRAGTITSSTTGVPFTNYFRSALCKNTLSRLYALLDEFEKAQYFEGKFEKEFLLDVRKERLNSGEGSFNVAPYGM